jgi:hypothetical protein
MGQGLIGEGVSRDRRTRLLVERPSKAEPNIAITSH